MKIEYLIDFLPSDLRRRTALRVSRRRSTLLLVLMSLMVLGVAAHSWKQYRRADVDRAISMEVCTNAIKVDDVVDKLAAEQQAISKFLGVYDHIALPLDMSDLVATVTHLMPERMSLAMLRFQIETEKVVPPEPAAKPKPGKAGKDAAPAAASKPPATPKRWIYCTIRGFAASNDDVFDFERRLNKTKPLEAVTVTDNKPTEVPGSQLQEFSIHFRIPLNARYELTPAEPVAAAPRARAEVAQ